MPLWVADMDFEVGSFIQDAISKRIKNKTYGYEIIPSDIKELLKTYQRVNNLKLNIKKAHIRKGDIPVSFAKVSKIKNQLGWKAKYNLKDMCSSSYRFAKKLLIK